MDILPLQVLETLFNRVNLASTDPFELNDYTAFGRLLSKTVDKNKLKSAQLFINHTYTHNHQSLTK